jgi:hypothetical protein
LTPPPPPSPPSSSLFSLPPSLPLSFSLCLIKQGFSQSWLHIRIS